MPIFPLNLRGHIIWQMVHSINLTTGPNTITCKISGGGSFKSSQHPDVVPMLEFVV